MHTHIRARARVRPRANARRVCGRKRGSTASDLRQVTDENQTARVWNESVRRESTKYRPWHVLAGVAVSRKENSF